MNEKIQAILLKIVLDLKKLSWEAHPDWEITLKSEGHVPMIKQIGVEGSMGDDDWRDIIETHLDIKLISDDEITYFPNYTIYAAISINDVASKDIAYKMDADVAFTERDVRDQSKITLAAKRIDRMVENHIEQEYGNYVSSNSQSIKYFKNPNDELDNNQPER